MSEEDFHFEIPDIGNAYGGLNLKKENGKFYWGIENYDDTIFREIPESLFNELDKFYKQEKTK